MSQVKVFSFLINPYQVLISIGSYYLEKYYSLKMRNDMNQNENNVAAKKSNGLTLIQLMTIIGAIGILIAVVASKLQ